MDFQASYGQLRWGAVKAPLAKTPSNVIPEFSGCAGSFQPWSNLLVLWPMVMVPSMGIIMLIQDTKWMTIPVNPKVQVPFDHGAQTAKARAPSGLPTASCARAECPAPGPSSRSFSFGWAESRWGLERNATG